MSYLIKFIKIIFGKKEKKEIVHNEEFYFFSDRPLVDPVLDRLGYYDLSKHITEIIIERIPLEGLVIAIYGGWGTGKSTLLNFIVSNIRKIDENKKPVVVNFNPWWYSNKGDLIKCFFDQIVAVLNIEGERFFKIGRAAELIGDFAEFISYAPIPYISYAKPVGKIIKFVSRDSNRKKGVKNVFEIKEKIEEALKISEKSILVIIDDVDRLTSTEIRQLFQTIKAVANFPNIIYLLALDKERAIRALSELYSLPGEQTKDQYIQGENYLKKIIQVPIELPPPYPNSLTKMLKEQLNSIFKIESEDLVKIPYTDEIFETGIEHFIETPRDMVRLINTVKATFLAIKGEVNPNDFILIETLRIFCPDIYYTIRNNPKAFIEFEEKEGSFTFSKIGKKDYSEWLYNLNEKDREVVEKILCYLFPKYLVLGKEDSLKNTDGIVKKWRKELKICSPDRFHNYFRLSIQEGGVSNLEILELLSKSNDQNEFSKFVLEIKKKVTKNLKLRISSLFTGLHDYIEDIDKNNVQFIVKSFFDIGDLLIEDEEIVFNKSDFDILDDLWNLFRSLLLKVTKKERFEIISDAIIEGKSITIPSLITSIIKRKKEYLKKDFDFLPSTKIDILVDNIERKMKRASEDSSILKTPFLPEIISQWDNLPLTENVQKYTESLDSFKIADLIIDLYDKKNNRFKDNYIEIALKDTKTVTDRLNDSRLEEIIYHSLSSEDRIKMKMTLKKIDENKRIINEFIKKYS